MRLEGWKLFVVIGVIFLITGILLALLVASINVFTTSFHGNEVLEQQLLGTSLIIDIVGLLWIGLAYLDRAGEQAKK